MPYHDAANAAVPDNGPKRFEKRQGFGVITFG
jgi:hypothetical protein